MKVELAKIETLKREIADEEFLLREVEGASIKKTEIVLSGSVVLDRRANNVLSDNKGAVWEILKIRLQEDINNKISALRRELLEWTDKLETECKKLTDEIRCSK